MMQFALFPALLGSDQLVRLDGRWGRHRVRQAVADQAARLSRLHPSTPICRAVVYRGQLKAGGYTQLYEVRLPTGGRLE